MTSRTGQKWIRTIGVAVFGVAILVLLGHLRNPQDPSTQGKRLSEWLRVYLPISNAALGSPQRQAADDAIRRLGEKAIPFLLHELQAADDSGAIIWWYMSLRRAHVVSQSRVSSSDRKIAVSRAFLALGSAASNAVPGLMALREMSRSLDSQCFAISSLGWIGPSAEAAVPMLLRDATNENPRLRADALWALGDIRAQPSLAVPVLTSALNSPNEWVKACAAHALGNFGASAWSAIGALSAVTNRTTHFNVDRNLEARMEALNAIRMIESAQKELEDPLAIFSPR